MIKIIINNFHTKDCFLDDSSLSIALKTFLPHVWHASDTNESIFHPNMKSLIPKGAKSTFDQNQN